MTTADRQAHWQNVYLSKGDQDVSWWQSSPQPSLGLIEQFAQRPEARIVDIGGGASRLVDALREKGFSALTVLDISEAALQRTRDRLGVDAANVQWVVADVTTWKPEDAFDVWHDRAAFHFLVEAGDREAYLDSLRRGVKTGGHAIIGTFAPDGPEKCSGLPVQRYDPAALSRTAGDAFELVEARVHRHTTPWGAVQSFQFSVLRRR